MVFYKKNKDKLDSTRPEDTSFLGHAGDEFDKLLSSQQAFYYQEAEKLRIEYLAEMKDYNDSRLDHELKVSGLEAD